MQDSGGCHCQFGPHVPGIRNPEVRIFPKSLPPRIVATKQLFPQVGDSCIIILSHDLLKHDKAFFALEEGYFLTALGIIVTWK